MRFHETKKNEINTIYIINGTTNGPVVSRDIDRNHYGSKSKR